MTPARKHIDDELQELAPGLAGLSSTLPYGVPSGYFDQFPLLLLEELRIHHPSPLEEMKELSPLLAGLQKTMPYSVPDSYFDQLQPAIPEEQPAKLIRLVPRNRFMRYAAAAVVAGILALGSWFFLDRSNTPNPRLAQKGDSLAEHSVTQSVQAISDDEIDDYLENNNLFLSTVSSDLDPEDLKLLLLDVSDQELENYLKRS